MKNKIFKSKIIGLFLVLLLAIIIMSTTAWSIGFLVKHGLGKKSEDSDRIFDLLWQEEAGIPNISKAVLYKKGAISPDLGPLLASIVISLVAIILAIILIRLVFKEKNINLTRWTFAIFIVVVIAFIIPLFNQAKNYYRYSLLNEALSRSENTSFITSYINSFKTIMILFSVFTSLIVINKLFEITSSHLEERKINKK